jgi:feruloyl esterase
MEIGNIANRNVRIACTHQSWIGSSGIRGGVNLKRAVILGVLAVLAQSPSVRAEADSCAGLAKLKLPQGEIVSSAILEKGAFTPPPNPFTPPPPQPGTAPAAPSSPPPEMLARQAREAATYKTLPSFCRVQAALRPTADSLINVEIWMPAESWNGRLEEVGNGAFGSNIQFSEMAQGLAKGYATAASDTGHQGNDSSFAIGHPEKLVDWGNRSIHETTVTAKAVLAAYYGAGPKHSYWNSCSTGGRQGWIAAEYYPNDFDGLVIGDPANPMTRLQAGGIWASLALNKDADSFIPAEKWAMIHKAVVEQCDAKDGLKDGLVADYRQCGFDVQTLACKQGDAAGCLTAAQIEALGKVVAGARNPRTGEQIYPGYPLGVAMLPGPVAGKNRPDPSGPTTYRLLFQDPGWDYHTLDFDSDIARADKIADTVMNAVEPAKLKPLFDRGGKILLYHGWDDPAISALISIELYEQAVAANGGLGKTYGEIRLFMAPGMNHCGGGEGPNAFDKLDTIVAWVEQGKAPDRIAAAHADASGKVDRTRPLCPYPQIAKYKGAGSIDEAQNFVCAAP